MQAAGAIAVSAIKSISAVKPKREGGHARSKKRRGGENVVWHRIVDNIEDVKRKFGTNPNAVGPLGRWHIFGHLTPFQVLAGGKYASVMQKFEQYHVATGSRTARSQSFEPTRGAEDQEIQRRTVDGSLAEYERRARKARKQYDRVMKVLGRFTDPVSGRNFVKDALDELCCSQREPAAAYRQQLGAVLSLIGKEFGLEQKATRRMVSTTPRRRSGMMG